MSHLDDDAVAVTTRGASSSIPMGVIFVQQVQNSSLKEIAFVLFDSYNFQVYADTLRELMPKAED